MCHHINFKFKTQVIKGETQGENLSKGLIDPNCELRYSSCLFCYVSCGGIYLAKFSYPTGSYFWLIALFNRR
jgi:hypothetical protein